MRSQGCMQVSVGDLSLVPNCCRYWWLWMFRAWADATQLDCVLAYSLGQIIPSAVFSDQQGVGLFIVIVCCHQW
jgi:hypothetical protein